nr:hypothetical protein [Veillonella atypica]
MPTSIQMPLVIEPYANPFRTYPLVRDYESYKKLFKECGVDCYIMNTGFFLEKKIPKEVTIDLLERPSRRRPTIRTIRCL